MAQVVVAFWREIPFAITLLILVCACSETIGDNHTDMGEDRKALYPLSHPGKGDSLGDSYNPKEKSPPTFKDVLPSVTQVCRGDSIEFGCEATGNPSPNITWLKNGRPFNTPTIWTVSLKNIEFTDEGFYKCIVCNELGCIEQSTSLNLPMYVVSEFGSKTSHKAVYAGNTALLTCPNDYWAPVSWFRILNTNLTTALSTMEPVKADIISKNKLIIQNASTEDAGWYMCIVSSDGCKNGSVAEIQYLYLSVIEIQLEISAGYPGNKTVYRGATALLTCPYIKRDPDPSAPTHVSWFRSLNQSLNDDGLTSTLEPVKADYIDNDTLIIQNVTTEDEAWYICMVTSKYKNDTAKGYLLVVEPKLEISAGYPGNKTVYAGTTALLTCPYIKRDPDPPESTHVSWFRSLNQSLNDDSLTSTLEPVKPDYISNDSLIIQNVTTEDEAWYICMVTSNYKNDTAKGYLSVVEPQLEISAGYPGNKTVYTGATALLTCPYIKRDPDPPESTHVSWFRSLNQSLNDDGLPSTLEPVVANYISNDKLIIPNVTTEDEGWYVCMITSKYKTARAKGYLSVVEMNTSIIVYTFVAILLVTLVGVVLILKKMKRERRQKQQAIEAARAAVVYWTKVVTVQRRALPHTPDCELLVPEVRVERRQAAAAARGDEPPPEYELPADPHWELDRRLLACGSLLGQGEFGRVLAATLRTPDGDRRVAVKMLKEGHSESDMVSLVSEMEVMKVIGRHENIVNLVGCCTQGGPPLVVVEYAALGCLQQFLRQRRPEHREELASELAEPKTLTLKDLASFAVQIAKGMKYLASRKCIHRDLAARNVLVTADCVLKIADFGMAKDLDSKDYYRKKTSERVPVRWMAPESLQRKVFSTESDVWSFGVLLWELATLARTPHAEVPPQCMWRCLQAGHRLQRPPYATPHMYRAMCACWSLEPADRPSFYQLVLDLEQILAATPATHLHHISETHEESILS